MTTSVLDRVPLEEITAQAREVRFTHALLTAVAFALIGFGRVLGYAWLVPVWCALAVREGWRDVHPPRTADGRAGAR